MVDDVNEENYFCTNQLGGMPHTPSNKLHPSQKTDDAILKNSVGGNSPKDETRIELKDAHRNWKNENSSMRSF